MSKGYAAPMAPKSGGSKTGAGGGGSVKMKRDTGMKSNLSYRKSGRGFKR